MIKRPEQVKLLALGLPDVPANRSGGSSSSSTATTTTTNVTDRRFVNDGGGAGVAGDNNQTWNSVSTTNVTTDLGAIAGAMDLAKTGIQMGHADMNSALKLADQTFTKVIDTNKGMFDTNASNMMDGFSKLLDASKTVMQTAQQVNASATQDVANAYQAAHDASTGQQFMVAGGLLIAGIVAIKAIGSKL